MVTVKVNGQLNGLVHKGGNWLSIATLPDFCKTPTPGGPVPMPYPNISQASSLADGTTTVKVDGGNMAAIKGSKFAISSGDEPGSLGGVKSNTFKQASTWITYSFDVKLDGKNACRFSDKKFQNNENTVDATGVIPLVVRIALAKVKMACGELGQYGPQKRVKKKGRMARDHIPAKQALKERAMQLKGGLKKRNGKPVKVELNDCEIKTIEDAALTIVIPSGTHPRTRSYGKHGKQMLDDADNLEKAAKDDLKKIQNDKNGIKKLSKKCQQAYAAAARKIRSIKKQQYDNWLRRVFKKCAKGG